MKYLVVVEQSCTGFSAYVPDLLGCVAAAETRSELLPLIREAIEFHIEGLKQAGEPVPRGSMSHHLAQLSLRPAVDSDLPWLLELRLQTMSRHIERSGEELSVEDQRDRVLYRYDCIHIVELDSVPVGMMKVIRNEDPWQLVQIQVRPENQGQGLGETLVRQLLDDGQRQGVAVSLHVLKVNPAKNLYGRLGFTVVADRGHSYEMRCDA